MGVNLKPTSCAPRSRKTGHFKRKRLIHPTMRCQVDLKVMTCPRVRLTEEEIQRVVREELKLVKSDLKKVRKEHKLSKSHLANLVRRH